VTRDIESNWDYFFVEAHPVGSDDWTTLPDANGHTSRATGNVCPFWLGLHPFLEHYQTATDDGCAPEGTTGEWHSDDLVALPGAWVDDIVGPGGQGSTSFEADGDPMDGWTVPGAPAGSEPNPNDWIVGTVEISPEPLGATIDASLAQQPEILAFEASLFGRYPFSVAGGIVDIAPIGFALETQTRPIYSTAFFTDAQSGEDVVVHELAHQRFGDYLTVARWSEIWLNEGFATYAEWLSSEHDGRETAQEIFDFYYNGIPASHPFWTNVIGHPESEDLLFDISVYWRGAMALHALRNAVGDEKFFRLLRVWVREQRGGHVTIDEFIATAERVTRMQLDDLFETWLFTPSKPESVGTAATGARALSAPSLGRLPARPLKR
jgi:hypothetical protein